VFLIVSTIDKKLISYVFIDYSNIIGYEPYYYPYNLNNVVMENTSSQGNPIASIDPNNKWYNPIYTFVLYTFFCSQVPDQNWHFNPSLESTTLLEPTYPFGSYQFGGPSYQSSIYESQTL